ncbi:DUF167 domain-containing protein [Qipengyuania sp. GH1]|uniref:DUF167 domain-containing protein n=1 Tax=Qipengyuania aestuarii TaxID=2867241 RepID=UPI001C88845B|nr:DUF167 domain-containing protein [Qipengyuania aestuarii]MBX7536547.1 DUF167 domain-containing protein [Qipengyuania aestuarii]
MKRSAVEFPDREDLLALLDPDGRLRIKATPGARQDAMKIEQGQLIIKTRAKPQDGAANRALCEMLARAFGIAKSRCHLLRGDTAREKTFRLEV